MGTTTALVTPNLVFGRGKVAPLIILHTNDLHCHIDAHPDNHPMNAGKGGLYRIAAYVKKMRETYPELLLFDSGDYSQGTPYYNFFGAELILKAMSEMQYSASTIGNHEFDNGLEKLAEVLSLASFPMVISNYDFSLTPLKERTVKNIVLETNGIRVGVYGLGIELEGLVDPSKSGNTRYLDPLETALSQEDFLRKEEKCDFIICLSHLGYAYREENRISDVRLATQTYNTDLILGGHTHTFLDQPREYKNKQNQPVLVNQAGWAALQLGQLMFWFERKNKFFFDNTRNHSF